MDDAKPLKRVGTHDGRFHADEVMATAILKEIYEVEVIRTRDSKILSELDIVYDVAGGEFDHHSADKVYRENGIPYAACGLIWKSFGKEVIHFKYPSLNEEGIDSIFYYIDRVLLKGIDALDNGVKVDGEGIPMMNITSIISGFNPSWHSQESEDAAFDEAVEIASAVLDNTINRRFSVLKAKDNVLKAYESRKIAEVLILETYCPYGEVLQEIDEKKEVLFVIYPRKNEYAIQTVRERGGVDRKKLPKDWAGKRDEELAVVSGVEDAVFCHTGRFMAVAGSFEGIMKMAELAIKEPREKEPRRIFIFIRRLFLRLFKR
jgi:uncharacterized UPF0160 family protein